MGSSVYIVAKEDKVIFFGVFLLELANEIEDLPVYVSYDDSGECDAYYVRLSFQKVKRSLHNDHGLFFSERTFTFVELDYKLPIRQ